MLVREVLCMQGGAEGTVSDCRWVANIWPLQRLMRPAVPCRPAPEHVGRGGAKRRKHRHVAGHSSGLPVAAGGPGVPPGSHAAHPRWGFPAEAHSGLDGVSLHTSTAGHVHRRPWREVGQNKYSSGSQRLCCEE